MTTKPEEPTLNDGTVSDDPTESEQVAPQTINVVVPEGALSGIYANFARVSHDADGFMIEFYTKDPGDPLQAVLQAQIHIGHRMASRFHSALGENITRWAVKELEAREQEEASLRDVATKGPNVEQGPVE